LPKVLRFGSVEAAALLIYWNLARTFLPFPKDFIDIGMSAAWLPVLLSTATVLGFLGLTVLVLRHYRRETMVEVAEDLFGPAGGVVTGVLLTGMFAVETGLILRQYSEAMLITALPRTTISVVTGGFLLTAAWVAYLGLEPMARTCRITLPHFAGGILLLMLALIPMWNWQHLFPFWGRGLAMVPATLGFSTNTSVLLATLLLPVTGDWRQVAKAGLWGIVFGYLILLIVVVSTVLVFTPEVARQFSLPFFSVSKNIYVGRYLQHIEAIYIIIWGVVGVLRLATGLYAAAEFFRRAFRLPYYQPLLWPLGVLIFIISLIPASFAAAYRLDELLLRADWLPVGVLPLVLLAAVLLKGRRAASRAG